MTTLVLDNFGGEIPRVSKRALPAGAAQLNRNLLATSVEFRPVPASLEIAPAVLNATSLHRRQKKADGTLQTDSAEGWSTDLGAISFVRSQLADDLTERTYLSFDDGQRPPVVMSSALSSGYDAQYLLGIPAPAKPEVALLTASRFTRAQAMDWLTNSIAPAVSYAIASCLDEDQAFARFTDQFGRKLTTGGIYGSTRAGVTRFDPAQYEGASPGVYEYFPSYPSSQRGAQEPWNIMMRIPAVYAPKEGVGSPLLGGVAKLDPLDSSTPVWIGIAGLPLWGVLDTAALKTKLQAFRNPLDAEAPLWSDNALTALLAEVTSLFSTTSTAVMAQRHALDAAVSDFAVSCYQSISLAKPAMPVEPVSVGDKFLVASDGQGGYTQTLNPLWDKWRRDQDAFVTAKGTYTTDLARWSTTQTVFIAKAAAAQVTASAICAGIEILYGKVKGALTELVLAYLSGTALERTQDTPDGMVVIDDDSSVENRFYLATWVSSFGEESAPSPPSDMLAVTYGDLVSVKQPALPTGTAGQRDIKAWRLYRSNSGSTSTAFKFVAEAPVGATIAAPIVVTGGSTESLNTGLELTHKWRDPVATYMIYHARGMADTTLDAYTSADKLVIGDTATQSDGKLYTLTQRWNGSAWTVKAVPDASALVGTVAYLDGVISDKLGEVCPSVTWLTPPTLTNKVTGAVTHLQGLIGCANGVMAGFVDNFVAFTFSELYVPYAWPVEYQVPLGYPVVGLCAFGQSILVGTKGSPSIISGADSASMSEQKLDSAQSCVSRRSMVAAMGGVFYASPDGYCFASQNGVEVATQDLFSREDWQKLDPASIFSIVHDSVLYFWYTGNGGGCYGLDMVARKLTQHDIQASAVFYDVITDAAYVVDQNKIKRLFATGRALGAWTSRVSVLPRQTPFAWLKVLSDFEEGSVTVRWFGDGVLRRSVVVSSREPVRLNPGRYLEHVIEVESASRVTRVVMAGSTAELQNE